MLCPTCLPQHQKLGEEQSQCVLQIRQLTPGHGCDASIIQTSCFSVGCGRMGARNSPRLSVEKQHLVSRRMIGRYEHTPINVHLETETIRTQGACRSTWTSPAGRGKLRGTACSSRQDRFSTNYVGIGSSAQSRGPPNGRNDPFFHGDIHRDVNMTVLKDSNRVRDPRPCAKLTKYSVN